MGSCIGFSPFLLEVPQQPEGYHFDPEIAKHNSRGIIKNFEGSPYGLSGGTGSISDIHCYDNASPDVIKYVHNRIDPDPASFDLNSSDWLFSGWADYWAWRASMRNGRVLFPVNYPVTYPAMPEIPNLLKAISLRETVLGLQKQTATGLPQSLLNFTEGSGYYRLVSNPDDKFDEPYKDMVWGLMDVSASDRFNPIMEVGVAVRVFYANYFFIALRHVGAGHPHEEILRNIVGGLANPNEQSSEGYAADVWRLANEGRLYVSQTNTLYDFWGRYRTTP